MNLVQNHLQTFHRLLTAIRSMIGPPAPIAAPIYASARAQARAELLPAMLMVRDAYRSSLPTFPPTQSVNTWPRMNQME